MLGSVTYILLAVVAISLLVGVHELGHLIAAKAVGMRVEAFAIGFWKKLVSFRIGETEYRLCLIPLGGYVKVSGESHEQGSGDPGEFWSKSPGQRSLFILGGITMNLVFAIGLFVIAFAIGVPFPVGEVGETVRGQPAWEAGLKAGDKILAAGDMQDPNFMDLTRAVALGNQKAITFRIERDGRELDFRIQPRYDPELGIRQVGIIPPLEPIITGFYALSEEDAAPPAQEAGLELRDRILAVNGVSVASARDVELELLVAPNDEIELLVERNGRQFAVSRRAEPVPHFGIGISTLSATIEALQRGGPAQQAGLRVGDRLTLVSGTPVASAIEFEEALRGGVGRVELGVERDGRPMAFEVTLPDLKAVEIFQHSIKFEAVRHLTWVEEDSPASTAGMRPGDVIVSVGGRDVESWRDIVREGQRHGKEERQIQWMRGEELVSALVTPVRDYALARAQLGIMFGEDRRRIERYGAVGAVKAGLTNTVLTIREILFMLRGFATRQVSPRQMGGIVTIARVSYLAAERGLGSLLHITAIISASLAFLNILPIPVLDGGHLLFLVIEKVRGRRVGERALMIAQAMGFALLMLLVVYVTWNDIMRLLPGR